MNLKAYLFDDDRGVSPVIGVILMVAITVILAAVIATFVMNMGPDTNTPANANWDWDAEELSTDEVHVILEHSGGAAAPTSEYDLQMTSDSDDDSVVLSDIDDTEMTAGDTLEIRVDDSGTDLEIGTSIDSVSDLESENPEFTLIWNDPDSDQTQIIETWEP